MRPDGKEFCVHIEPRSFDDALSYCHLMRGKLVEPKSDQDNNDLIGLATSAMHYQNKTINNGIWIGISDGLSYDSVEGKQIAGHKKMLAVNQQHRLPIEAT